MMMRIWTIILVIATLYSCQKEVEYQGEGKAPVLVLDGILKNHEPIRIRLTRSIFFLSNSNNVNDVAVNDAVAVFTNVTTGTSVTLTNSGNGIYFSNEIIQPNTSYRIEISHPKYPTISSEMTTILDPEVLDIDTSSFTDNFGSLFQKIIVRFDDPIGEDFYSLSGFLIYQNTYINPDSTVLSIDTTTAGGYASSEDLSLDFYDMTGLFFKDVLFEGNLKYFSMYMYSNSYFQEYVLSKVIARRVLFNRLSKDTYRYLSSKQKNAGGDPFSDPSNVYTNVINGLGIFGSYSSSDFTK
jgi:hypothetical protein